MDNQIKITEIKCPGCGSPLKMSMGRDGLVRCEYCGGEYAVDWDRGSVMRRRIPEWAPAMPVNTGEKPPDKAKIILFRMLAFLICAAGVCGFFVWQKRQGKEAEKEEPAVILEKIENPLSTGIETQETKAFSGMLGEMIAAAFGKEADAVTQQELSRIKWIADRRDFDFYYIGYSFEDPLENSGAELTWLTYPDDAGVRYESGYEMLAACTGLKKLETKRSLAECNLEGLKLESLSASFNTPEEAASAVDDPALVKELGIGNSVDSLDGLENFTNLEKLSVNAGDLSDIDEAVAMRRLKSLTLLNADKISDFSVLASLEGLEELSLESENLKSLDFLKRMPQLKSLSLSDGQILDLSGIETLKNLEKLSVTDCSKLENMDGLEHLTGLRELELEKPYNCGEPPLAGLTALQSLSLNSFHSCDFLRELKELKSLTLRSCEIPEELDLSGLENLTELTCTASYQDMPMGFVRNIRSLENVNLQGMVTYDDISGIFMLPHIKKIDISGIECEIAFDKIAENSSLETLLMPGVKLYENVKVSGGGGVVYVEWDDVYLAEHTDFITKFPNLKKLDIADNGIKDLEFAKDLSRLEEIDFSDNYISEMRPLAALPALRLVNCSGNPIGNLRVLDENITVINK